MASKVFVFEAMLPTESFYCLRFSFDLKIGAHIWDPMDKHSPSRTRVIHSVQFEEIVAESCCIVIFTQKKSKHSILILTLASGDAGKKS
jgi:hypothetical protein